MDFENVTLRLNAKQELGDSQGLASLLKVVDDDRGNIVLQLTAIESTTKITERSDKQIPMVSVG